MTVGLSADLRLRRGAFTLDAKFATPARGVTAVFGPSGAGKSLLLSAIAGLATLESGRLTLGDRVLDDVSNKAHIPPHQRGIGLVFQDARLFPHLSVRGNLAYALKRAPLGGRSISFEQAVAHFDIEALLDRPVRNLSGGEKSRVALARSLLSAPDILLLDEPFAALDGLRRRAFLAVLRTIHATFHLPMIVVTHQIDDVTALADHVVAVRAGKVVAAGPLVETVSGQAFQSLLDARDVGAAVVFDTPRNEQGPAAWVRADHVLLASAAPSGLSARHIWPARITALAAEASDSILVTLEASVGVLRARVTRAATNELHLAVGGEAWAVVKTHAL